MNIDSALKTLVRGSKDTGFYETLLYLAYRDWVAKPNSTAIDIGAHTGLHTFRLADCVGPKGKVFAFEPLPELADQIEAEAVRRYPDDKRVVVRREALSDKSGRATFYRNPSALSQSTLISGHAPNKQATQGFKVKISTLDEAFGEQRPKYVSVLKIDAESAEFKILNGARKLLSETYPMIAMEFGIEALSLIGKTSDDFFDLCDDLGYVFFNVDGTEYSREFVASGERMQCYERFGAKRGHWVESYLRTKLRGIMEKHIAHVASSRGIVLEDA